MGRRRQRKYGSAPALASASASISEGFLFIYLWEDWVEFGYIVFGLNGAQWVFS